MIITDGNNNNSNGNERDNSREGVHPHACGEHAPAMLPMNNSLSGKTEIMFFRPPCTRQCSRFCHTCDCCKFLCGHISIISDEDDEDDEEEDFGLGDEIFDAGKN